MTREEEYAEEMAKSPEARAMNGALIYLDAVGRCCETGSVQFVEIGSNVGELLGIIVKKDKLKDLPPELLKNILDQAKAAAALEPGT